MAWLWLKLLIAWLQSKLVAVVVVKATGGLAVAAVKAAGSITLTKKLGG